MPTALTLRVVGDKDEGILDTFSFYPGEVRELTLQLFDETNEQKIAIPSTATAKTLILAATPNNLQVNDADIILDNDDASIFSVNLSAEMTNVMITGSVQFSYTVNTVIRKAVSEFALKRLTTMES